MLVLKISSVAVIASKSLQSHSKLVYQQCEALEKLHATLIDIFSVRLVSDSERDALGANENLILSTDGHLCLNVDDILVLLEDLGTFVVDCVESLTD